MLCRSSNSCFLLFLGEHDLFKVLPQDAEKNTLQAIRQNLGLQTSKHETLDTRFGQDSLNDLWVRQLIRMRLLVRLDDTDRVGACIRNGRRAKTQDSSTSQFGQLCILLGDKFTQVIVGEEPTAVRLSVSTNENG